MYERFTDRARKVMQLANQEAQGFNHEYIGTEHILLGLVREGTGVAAQVLADFNLDLGRIRREVERVVSPGPDMVTIGKLPQTPRAKKVIELAITEARTLGHDYIGTEHMLLGLLAEHEGVAAQVLLNLGLELGSVREAVLNLLGVAQAVQATSAPELAVLPSTIERALSVSDRLLDLLQALKQDAIAAMELERAASANEQMTSVLRLQAWLHSEQKREPPPDDRIVAKR